MNHEAHPATVLDALVGAAARQRAHPLLSGYARARPADEALCEDVELIEQG